MEATEPLFKGLTRPAMIFGVPIAPFLLVIGGIIIIGLWTNILIWALAIPMLFLLKFLTKIDDFIFRLSFLKIKMFTSPASKKAHKFKTYSTNTYDEIIYKKVDLPRLNSYNLKNEATIQKFIPYQTLLTDGIVTTKDFQLLSTWKIEGANFEVEEEIDIQQRNNSLNMIIKAFTKENVSFYFHNARHDIFDVLEGNFPTKFSQEINDKYYEGFKKGSLKNNSLFLTLIYNPFKARIDRASFVNTSIQKKYDELKIHISKMNEFCGRLENNLEAFKPIRLKKYTKDDIDFSSQLEFYNYLIGGQFNPVRALNAPIDEYLTGNLTNVQFNKDMIQLNYADGSKRFARMLEIKDYTDATFSGILDSLMYLDINYNITQSFSPLAKIEAKEALKKQRNQLNASEDDAPSQILQLDEALDDLQSSNISFGNYHFSILIFGNSIKETKYNTNKVITSLNEIGIMSTLSSIALPANFFAQFPTNYALRPRVNLLSSKNYSSLIALHNFPKGKKSQNCWGDAITILKTPNKQPFYFNLHKTTNDNNFDEKFVGNTLLLGSTGGGKTMLLSFLVCQLLKFSDKNTFAQTTPEDKKKLSLVVLDKDKGLIGTVKANGGRYITIENGIATGFNPFMCEFNEKNLNHLQELVKMLVTMNGEKLTARQVKSLQVAIISVMDFEKDERLNPISLMLEHLTEDLDDDNSLRSRLELWAQGNKFGWVFDNGFDLLDFPNEINLFGIDGTEFLNDANVCDSISYYLLWRVKELVDGRRYGLIVDETWQWIKNSATAEEFKDDLKTIRKKNGFIMMATQSPVDFLTSSIARDCVEQSENILCLTNVKAKEKDYIDGFGFTQEEYKIVKDFEPSKYEFLVKKGKDNVICKMDLSAIGKENLKILSTDKDYVEVVQDIFDQENKTTEQKVDELRKFYKG